MRKRKKKNMTSLTFDSLGQQYLLTTPPTHTHSSLRASLNSFIFSLSGVCLLGTTEIVLEFPSFKLALDVSLAKPANVARDLSAFNPSVWPCQCSRVRPPHRPKQANRAEPGRVTQFMCSNLLHVPASRCCFKIVSRSLWPRSMCLRQLG